MSPGRRKPTPAPDAHPAARRAGRPSNEEAGQLRERILDAATELLLNDGYGATSIESIARRARISKRTFYSRFRDKPALMGAVVTRLIDHQRPPADVPLLAGDGVAQKLEHLATLILRAALNPQVLALHRLIVAESGRFPDLAEAVASSGGREEAVALIAGLLLADRSGAPTETERVRFAAGQFLQMVVSLPQLRALGLGSAMQPPEIESWVRQTVGLFLDGYRGPS
jgi:TetR/AcrR family transcriptional repressor of mexJK operon